MTARLPFHHSSFAQHFSFGAGEEQQLVAKL